MILVFSEKPCTYNVRLGSSNWLYDTEDHHLDVTVQAIYRHPDFGSLLIFIRQPDVSRMP